MKKSMARRIISLLLVLLLAVGMLPTGAMAADAPQEANLVIATVEQFKAFAGKVNGGESYEGQLIVLTVNLDLGGKEWTPIGNSSKKFQGTFDGKYHTISGLNVSQAGYAGLFGYLGSGGTIKNLAVSGTVNNTSNYAGGVVAYNAGTVTNCLSDVAVTSTGNMTGYYTAGIAGDNHGSISGCVNIGKITGTTALGGIAGMNVGSVENCYNTGAINSTSGNHVGGVVGQMRSMGSATPSIINCYGVGTVTGSASNLGVLIGQHQVGDVTNCYYLSSAAAKGIGSGSATATAKTTDELKILASDLGSAFEAKADGYPALTWEKKIDTSAPVGPAFPEATKLSAQLSDYIRAAINAKRVAEKVPDGKGLLSTYTVSDTATDWIAVTMGRYGYQDGDTYKFLYDDGSGYTDYIAALQQDVTNKYAANNGKLHNAKATEWQRLILAVNAIGGDPTSFGIYNGSPVDLVSDGTYNHANPGWQGINGSIFGLLALDTKGYAVPSGAVTTREKFIKDLLALQLTDGVNGNEMGGWALSGSASDPDMTAMTIQALAPYYNSETTYTYTNKVLNKEMTQSVRQAVNAALDKLSVLQRTDGDYASWGTVNVESTAQVLVALCSLGIDPAKDERFIKNGKTLLDGILKYRLSGGGFSHSFEADSSNPSAEPGVYNYMATDQASYAMVAYWRFENGMRALYDMRDEWSSGGLSTVIAAVAAIKAVPAPSSSDYKAKLKSALEKFEQVPENERRYVSNYNDLATAIEIMGGKEALDSDEKFPVSMAITTPPTKTTYIEGESFNPAGMVVTLTYSDNSTAEITDYTLRPTGELTVSITEITVSYSGFTVTQKITVNEQAPWEGAGTESDPYLIQNLDDLLALKDWTDAKNKNTYDLCFKMTSNIDMSSVSDWRPIGLNRVFQGVFDGDGHYLTNYSSSAAWYMGIFGTVSGTVKNFGVASGALVQYSNTGAQGVIVNQLSSGKVINCWNGADATFKIGYSGAIVGAIRSGKGNVIEGCYNLGNISDETGPVGGIIGYSDSGTSGGSGVTLTIRNCYNMGEITSSYGNAGGILGHCRDGAALTGCYNAGKVTGGDRVGGLLGVNNSVTASSCFYLADNVVAEGNATITTQGESKTAEEMKSAEILTALGSAYKADSAEKPINNGYPVLSWQEFPPESVILAFSVTPADAKIAVKDANGAAVAANDDGTYTLVPGETCSYTISAQGYTPVSGSVAETRNKTVTVTLQPVSSGPVTPGDDPVKEYREKALASLKKQYSKFSSSDYSAENWAKLQAAYEKGIEDINAAKPAEAPYVENNIIAALNAALNAMQAVEPSGAGKITVVVSVDANTLGLGYIVKPTLVEVDRYAKASAVLTGLLTKNGYSYEMTGSVQEGFYLVGIIPVDQTKATVAPFIVSAIGGENRIMYSDRNDTKLGEFDYYNMSGWMYSVDGSFPGVGAASWNMTDGEVMRWQFTVYGYGADLNADNSAWGTSSIVTKLGNKDALTWAVAELRAEKSDAELEKSDAYKTAMEVLQAPEATQSQIDAAYAALKGQGSSSGGGSTGPEASGDVIAKPTATVDKDGAANVTMEGKDISAIIDQAKEEKTDKIVIEPEIEGDASKVSVELPKSALGDIAKDTGAALSVKTDVGTVTIPTAGLEELNGQPGSKVTISAEALKDDDGQTSGETKIEVAVDGKAVEKISGGITATVPVAEAGSGNVLVIVNADGSETVVKKSVVVGKTVTGLLDGSCTVKVADNTKSFNDSDGHWARDAIAFTSSHELFNGVGNGNFAPDISMSRAMLATVLYRLEDAKAAGSGAFPDVPDGTWYTDAVAWASDAGIVNGTGSGFDPNGNVTREQLAAMLYRYAKPLDMDTAVSGDLAKFADSSDTSDWAREAMQWAIGSGLISGKGNGMLDPTGSATRAEVATILQRLIGLMVK